MNSKISNAETWQKVEHFFAKNFTHGETPDMDTILFLIGVRELGKTNTKYKKDEKVNLIHIGVCRVLEPLGYYRFDGLDKDGWPHFEFIDELPPLKANEQQLMMKEAVIQYFLENELIEVN